MRIGIDGRLWFESGVGRYIRNLVLEIERQNKKDEFVIFLNSKGCNDINFKNPNFKKVKADIPWHSLREQLSFKKIIDGENVNLMHFPYFSYPILYNNPFIVTIHDLIIDHFPTGSSSSLPLPFYKLKRMGYKSITRNSVKKAVNIIAPSKATKNEIINLYHADENKIKVIYEGFDKLIAKNSEEGIVSDNFILYVGNAFPHKNLKKLINAYKELSRTYKIDLVCIGKGDYFYDKIESNPYPGLYFLHNIDDSALFKYYTNAKCLVMPSLMEGFGLPLLEAMSLSCPVVCSKIPALQEIGQNACLYFDPNNADDIYKTIEKVVNDEKVRKGMISKGKLQSKKFSWEDCASQTLKLYESSYSVRSG